jgi:hypothetical protein
MIIPASKMASPVSTGPKDLSQAEIRRRLYIRLVSKNSLPETLPDFKRAIQSEYCTVLVGHSQKPYRIPQDLLTQNFSTLQGTVHQSTDEPKEQFTNGVDFHEVEISVFEDFLLWLYAFKHSISWESIDSVIGLAIFAEQHNIHQLKNQTSDFLQTAINEHRWTATPEQLLKVYECVPSGSILRQLCFLAFSIAVGGTELVNRYGGGHRTGGRFSYASWEEAFNRFPGLGWDYFKHTQTGPKQITNTTSGGACSFHDHSDIPEPVLRSTKACPYPYGAPVSLVDAGSGLQNVEQDVKEKDAAPEPVDEGPLAGEPAEQGLGPEAANGTSPPRLSPSQIQEATKAKAAAGELAANEELLSPEAEQEPPNERPRRGSLWTLREASEELSIGEEMVTPVPDISLKAETELSQELQLEELSRPESARIDIEQVREPEPEPETFDSPGWAAWGISKRDKKKKKGKVTFEEVQVDAEATPEPARDDAGCQSPMTREPVIETATPPESPDDFGRRLFPASKKSKAKKKGRLTTTYQPLEAVPEVEDAVVPESIMYLEYSYEKAVYETPPTREIEEPFVAAATDYKTLEGDPFEDITTEPADIPRRQRSWSRSGHMPIWPATEAVS